MLPGVFKCDLRMQSDNDKSGYSLRHFSDLNYLFSFKQTHKKMFTLSVPSRTSPYVPIACTALLFAAQCSLISMHSVHARKHLSYPPSLFVYFFCSLFLPPACLPACSPRTIRYIWKMFHNLFLANASNAI